MQRTRWVLMAIFAIAVAMMAQTSALADPPPKPPIPAPPTINLPGAAAPPAGFSSWAQFQTVQERLDAAAERISAQRDSNYTGIIVRAQQRKLSVYWKGGKPPAGAVRAINEARRDGEVEVLNARYSEAELLAEADRVAHIDGVTAVSPNVDGSGLTVSLAPGRALPPKRQAPDSIPVTQTDTSTPAPASRGNDFAPYWGGARWNGCSTGFAISIGGVSKMLSAGHCAANGNTARDGGNDVMGTVSGDDNAHDRLYINTSSAGRIYDGGVAEVGGVEFSKPVVGASHSFVGDFLCTSGAYSGARCNEQVKAINQTINVGYLIYPTVQAEQLNHTNAIGNGDSGGPVFSLSSDPNKVIAKGTNTAIDLSAQVPCTGIPASSTRQCAWRFWYVDVVNSLSAYGASIITG